MSDYLLDPLFKRTSPGIKKLAKTARKELRQAAREKWAAQNLNESKPTETQRGHNQSTEG